MLHQGTLLHGIGKPDLGDYVRVVEGQSDAGSSWTVALSDGDVFDQACGRVTHGVEGGTVNVLGDVQGKGQLRGVERTLQLP